MRKEEKSREEKCVLEDYEMKFQLLASAESRKRLEPLFPPIVIYKSWDRFQRKNFEAEVQAHELSLWNIMLEDKAVKAKNSIGFFFGKSHNVSLDTHEKFLSDNRLSLLKNVVLSM
jgi:hypothetical protein